MKHSTTTNILIRSSLAVALTLAVWAPLAARSAETAPAKDSPEAKMKECCKEMCDQKKKMAEDMKAEDAALTEQVAKMNSAPDDKKMALLTGVVSKMAEQRVAMNERHAKMDEGMMKHMMDHMKMGKDSGADCPMMKDMKDKDDKAAEAHKEHHEEKK